jgi:hypothetical protein
VPGIEARSLEAERGELRARAAAPDGFLLDGLQQARPDAALAVPLVDPQDVDLEPVPDRAAGDAADDLSVLDRVRFDRLRPQFGACRALASCSLLLSL